MSEIKCADGHPPTPEEQEALRRAMSAVESIRFSDSGALIFNVGEPFRYSATIDFYHENFGIDGEETFLMDAPVAQKFGLLSMRPPNKFFYTEAGQQYMRSL